ncbi:hypothetical protein ACLOJK_036899 [Asimina triloba]
MVAYCIYRSCWHGVEDERKQAGDGAAVRDRGVRIWTVAGLQLVMGLWTWASMGCWQPTGWSAGREDADGGLRLMVRGLGVDGQIWLFFVGSSD